MYLLAVKGRRIVPHCLALLAFTSLSISFHHRVFAQDIDDDLALLYGDEETVSIATGTQKPLRLAPSVATVITSEDIRAIGATTLDDVLETVPGLHVSLQSRNGSHYSIRGIHTAYNPEVLLLLDGIPLVDSYTGGRLPHYIVPIHFIERVEVIRGPGSALYGADAFAGVINVITKSQEMPNSFDLGGRIGSFGAHGVWLNSRLELGQWKIISSLEGEKTDGDDNRVINADSQTGLDQLFLTNASLAPGPLATHSKYINAYLSATNKDFTVDWYYFDLDEAGIGQGIANALDPTGFQNSTSNLISGKYKNDLSENANLHLSANYLLNKQKSHYIIFPPGTILPIGADGNIDAINPQGLTLFSDGIIGSPVGREKKASFEAALTTQFTNQRSTRLAVGYQTLEIQTAETKNFGLDVIDGSQPVVDGTLTDVTGTPSIFMPDKDRYSYYLSLQYETSLLKDWELTLGLRYDDFSDFGDTFNPRLALVWQTNYKLTSKLLYGSAFRAPTLGEQFAINNPVQLGNEDLKPEETDTWELAFEYHMNYDTVFKANLFHYAIDGLIDYVPRPGTTINQAQNAYDQTGKGAEFEVDWNISNNLFFKSSLAIQNAEEDSQGADIPFAPQLTAYAELRWKPVTKWQLTTQLHHIADRVRQPGDLRAPVDDFTLLNFNLMSDKMTEHFDIAVTVKNALDEDYFEPWTADSFMDLPMPGRSLMFTLEYHAE